MAETTLKITYSDAPSRTTVCPGGVWGGPNFQGMVIANFYIEKHIYPQITVHIDDVKKTVTEDVHRNNPPAMLREVQTTLVMDPKTAEIVGRWLLEQSKIAQTLNAGVAPLVHPSA